MTKLATDIDCSSMPQRPHDGAGATCIKMDCQANDCTLDWDGHKVIGPGREPDPLTVFVYGTRGILVTPTTNMVTIKTVLSRDLINGFMFVIVVRSLWLQLQLQLQGLGPVWTVS